MLQYFFSFIKFNIFDRRIAQNYIFRKVEIRCPSCVLQYSTISPVLRREKPDDDSSVLRSNLGLGAFTARLFCMRRAGESRPDREGDATAKGQSLFQLPLPLPSTGERAEHRERRGCFPVNFRPKSLFSPTTKNRPSNPLNSR